MFNNHNTLTGNLGLPIIERFDLDQTPKGSRRHYWLKVISDGFANPISIPLMVLRGAEDGPTLGLTAAVHGNELNGIPVIQRLFNEVSPTELRGTIVAAPVVNVPSFMRQKRRFNDGVDLNHIMPGKADGNVSQVYAFRFMDRLVKHFDYLLDLHTASQGRINSYYIRADMDIPIVAQLARLQNPDIIIHNPPSDGTLRGAADELGIPAITLEVGNPSTFQKKLIRGGVVGLHNALCHLQMIDDEIEPRTDGIETVVCPSSKWLYTDAGGLLTVPVELRQKFEKGHEIAVLRDVFGEAIRTYPALEEGIVIGKSVNPISQTGARIIHMGALH